MARRRSTTRRSSRSRREPPTADPAGPGLAVVVFGLASAIAWGAGDFGGGWTGRRAPVFGIALGVDALGVVAMVLLGLVIGGPLPGQTTAVLAVLAGVCSVAGIVGLYTGLAVGRMGVVAPVTGVIAAALPVVVGIASDGLPGTPVIAGILAALVAVVVVSRTKDPDGRRSGIEYGIMGGVGLGLFNVVVGAFPDAQVVWPLVLIKLGALVPIALLVRLGHRPWRVPRPMVPAVIVIALLDLAGNGLYILATQAGRLDVAATLSSLYPVTTIVLAVAILRERLSASHLAGIVLAGVAIVLIAGGSAAPTA